MKKYLGGCLVLIVLGCFNSNSNQMIEAEARWHLSSDKMAAGIEIIAKLTNKNQDSILIEQVDLLKQPILALKVFDTSGTIMPTIPPATPSNESGTVHRVIPPHQTYQIRYNLNIFSPPLPKGKYGVTMKMATSDTTWFEVQ